MNKVIEIYEIQQLFFEYGKYLLEKACNGSQLNQSEIDFLIELNKSVASNYI